MSKISDLSDGGVIQGGDTLIAVRSGGNVKVTYGGSTTANIDGGTIDGTVIGGTTAAAGSFTTGSFTGNVTFGDNDTAVFGAGADLQIYHDGNNSIIKDGGTGDLFLIGSDDVKIQSASGEDFARFNENGKVTLYHNNVSKFTTESTGIDVTGVITTDGMTTSADINFGDNDKAVFGAGSDLQIYHDGGHSYIDDAGTGLLRLRSNTIYLEKYTGELLADFNADGYVSLLYDNSEKFRTTSTGIDVTGTVSADGLTSSGVIKTEGTSLGFVLNETDTTDLNSYMYLQSGNLRFTTTNDAFNSFDTRMSISNSTGDISFYEDTGTTPKFVWDASAESLGIGTSSPSSILTVDGGTGAFGSSGITLKRTGTVTGSSDFILAGTSGSEALSVRVNATERMRIDSAGNVGIGTYSPSSYDSNADNLVVGGESAVGLTLASSATNGRGSIYFADGTSGDQKYRGTINYFHSSDDLTITTAATERMRIDSSGNLLVGTTIASGASAPDNSGTASDAGIRLSPTGFIGLGTNQAPSGYFNRIGNDGDIIKFNKDGTTVGSIGTNSNTIYIDGSSANTGLQFAGSTIAPRDAGALSDAGVDLGTDSYRFKDLYLSGGVVFGATGGNVSSKTLDDYEEGTWTPALNMSSGSVSYTSQLGQYTKIGNQVTLTGWIYISGVSSPSGALNITVPFAASSTSTRPATMIMANNTTGVTGNVGMWINPNTQNMYLQIVNNADVSALNGSNMATNTELYVTITYITT